MRGVLSPPNPTEQAGRRRSRVRQRSKPSLGRSLSRNTSKDHARKPGYFLETQLQRLFEFRRCGQRVDAHQHVQIFREPRAFVKQDERRSSK